MKLWITVRQVVFFWVDSLMINAKLNDKRNPNPNPIPNIRPYPTPNQKPSHYPPSDILLSEISSQEQFSPE